MKKALSIISALVLFAFGTASFAEVKIAVLDFNKVMAESPQVAAAQTKLKNKFDARGKDIVEKQKAFQSDVENFNKNSPTMKEKDKNATQQKIVDQQKKLQEMQIKFQNDLNASQTEVMQDIVKKIETAVKKIAGSKNIDLVIAKAGTAYSKPEFDITDEVVKEMKK